MRVISLFSHKGGVGKTTINFNLAHSLAAEGKRIVVIDADPQCNLTQLAIPKAKYEALYGPGSNAYTIEKAFKPLVSGAGDLQVEDPAKIGENVWLVPGDIDLVEFENLLPTAWNEGFSGQERGARATSAPYRLAIETAKRVEADYVFFDIGPNVGALNRAVLLASDYFVVPATPDLFSLRAMNSLGGTLSNWVTSWGVARQQLKNPPFQLPPGAPHFLGLVQQHYNIYNGRETDAFRDWNQQMPLAVTNGILKPLSGLKDAAGTPLSEPASTSGHNLGSLKNFHSLVPKAQTHNVPIFKLRAPQVRGAHVTAAKTAGTAFKKLAKELVKRT